MVEKTSIIFFHVRIFIGLFAKNNLLLFGRKINTICVVNVLIRVVTEIPALILTCVRRLASSNFWI